MFRSSALIDGEVGNTRLRLELDPVGLVHMNGRVYDPEIGRFVSADPVIQFPFNLQNLNRYSYVLNNPLSFTDPEGFITEALNTYLTDLYSSLEGDSSSTSQALANLVDSALTNMAEDEDEDVLEWLEEQSSSLIGQQNTSDGNAIAIAFQASLTAFGATSDPSSATILTSMLSALNSAASAEIPWGAARDPLLAKYAEIIEVLQIDLAADYKRAAGMSFRQWLEAVAYKGDFDFKNSEDAIKALTAAGIYDKDLLAEFGNFHYGITAHAQGLGLTLALTGAGLNQSFRQGGGNKADAILAADYATTNCPICIAYFVNAALFGYSSQEETRYYGSQIGNDLQARIWTSAGFTWGDNYDDPPIIVQGWDYAIGRH